MSTRPVVHFPNLTAKAHPVILTLVALAWHKSRLPAKYNHVYHNLSADRDWMVADNFAEVFTKLRDLKVEEYGELAGVTMKFLIGDIATSLFRRALTTCERITNLARSAASAKQVESSPELEYFARDLVTLRAILDSRKAFIPRDTLVRYVALSESIVAYVRGMPEAEALNRKIRAITAPRQIQRAAQPAAQAPVVETQIQDAPVVPTAKVEPEILESLNITEADLQSEGPTEAG